MAEDDRDPTANLDPRYFPTGAVIERAIAERPKHDTIDGIIDWLAGPAQHIPSLGDEFDEFAWRLVAAGIPLLRTTLELRTLHPQYLGATFVWWRTTGRTVLRFVTHEVQDLYGHEDNPIRRVLIGGETLRRRVDIADDQLDFPILHDLKAEGATDYFALPIESSFGTKHVCHRPSRWVHRTRNLGSDPPLTATRVACGSTQPPTHRGQYSSCLSRVQDGTQSSCRADSARHRRGNYSRPMVVRPTRFY